MLKEIFALIQKEILLEWRQKFAFGGMLLYAMATVFICYLSFRHIMDTSAWNALLWIIILFVSVNASAKSFLQESKGRLLYAYTLASPQAIIFSKIIYNVALTIFLSLICFGCYALFLKNPVTDAGIFFCVLVLGAIGISSLLTMVSAIAGKTNNNFTMMAVLAFPIIMPLLLTIIKLSQRAIDGLAVSESLKYFLVLVSLDAITCALAYMLFPYLWKD